MSVCECVCVCVCVCMCVCFNGKNVEIVDKLAKFDYRFCFGISRCKNFLVEYLYIRNLVISLPF